MSINPQRTPYCHKIRYGITGAPILTEDEMDGTHAPGVGVRPTLIEFVYSVARDGKSASVSAAVTGTWTRFGEPADGQVTAHFVGAPSGWPVWLAEEARLHDPDAAPSAVSVVPPATNQTALRDRIAEALVSWTYRGKEPDPGPGILETVRANAYSRADAVLAVLPEPTDQAAVLTEAADDVFALDYDVMVGEEGDENLGSMREAWDLGTIHAEKLLRRLAAEAPQPGAVASCGCGEPSTLGTVHRADGPCYIAEAPHTETPDAHSCGNCDGIDPDSCLTNLDRPAVKAQQGATKTPDEEPGQWCKCPSCWGWFVEEHPGEDLDELGRDLGWWSGLPEHRDAPAVVAQPGKETSS